VPREFVYIDAVQYESRRVRRESISSGAALGIAGTQDAFRRALFELIERDAFMAVWLGGKSPARIDGLCGAPAELIDLLNRYRLDCRLFDIRSEFGVPVVLALTLDFSGVGPAVTTGLSAAEYYESAAEAAILESISYRRQVRLKQMSGDLPQVTDASGIVSVETRVAYWSDPERLSELPSWTAQPAGASLQKMRNLSCTSEQALERLGAAGYRVLQADVTALAAKAQGFEAVRVIVPELHPLYLSEAAMALHSAHLGSIEPLERSSPHPFA
jgi:ribosomal protein S12 methylthiotransferase accessory factor